MGSKEGQIPSLLVRPVRRVFLWEIYNKRISSSVKNGMILTLQFHRHGM